MKIYELEKSIEELSIPAHAYSLKGGLPNEAFCIGMENDIWSTYYCERGNKTGIREFNNEDEACEYFFGWIKKIFNK